MATGAVVVSMHTATTFMRDPDNQYRRGRNCGRADNPGYDQPEAVLTALAHRDDFCARSDDRLSPPSSESRRSHRYDRSGICWRMPIEGAKGPAPPDLLRLSVGLENPGDLIADLECALPAW